MEGGIRVESLGLSVDRRSCTFERCFVAHGQSYGLLAEDGDLLDRLASRVPLGWQDVGGDLGPHLDVVHAAPC